MLSFSQTMRYHLLLPCTAFFCQNSIFFGFVVWCSHAELKENVILSHMLKLRDGSLKDMHVFRKPYIVWNCLLFCNVHSPVYLALSIFPIFCTSSVSSSTLPIHKGLKILHFVLVLNWTRINVWAEFPCYLYFCFDAFKERLRMSISHIRRC